MDDTVEKLRPYVAKYKMNYPVLQGLNHDDIQNAYGPLWGIPVTALISRDGQDLRQARRNLVEAELREGNRIAAG